MALESDTQSAVIRDVRSWGQYAYSYKVIKANDVGIPDFFCCTKVSGAFQIEFKRPDGDGVVSAAQVEKRENSQKVGLQTFLVETTKDWVALKKYLGLSVKSLKEAGLDDLHDPYCYRKA